MTGHTSTQKKSGKSYSYYKCYSKLQKGPIACEGMSIPVEPLETFIIEQLQQLSKNKVFLSDKKKMLKILQSKQNEDRSKIEIDNIDKQISVLSNKLETLLSKLESKLIADEDFKPRYIKIKDEIANLSYNKGKLNSLENSSNLALKSLEASFDEISSFDNNWEYLDDTGKSLRINSIVKEIRATKEKIDMDIFLDFEDVSRMDRDSLRQ